MARKKQSLPLYVIVILIILGVTLFIFTPTEDPRVVETVEEGFSLEELEQIAIPAFEEGETVRHAGFTLSYAEEFEQPWWVAYVLTPWETVTKVTDRSDNFMADIAVSTKSASLADYKGSGYDRGHMAPFADLSWSEDSAEDSFYLSNMSPQTAALNRYAWADLEATVRTFSLSGPLCIVTGPVLTDGPYETIGENEVAVPKYYYKVVFSPYSNQAIAFVMPNEKCENSLESYAVSVDYVEELTNIDFFSLLEDSYEAEIEGKTDTSAWDFREYSSSVASEYGYDGTWTRDYGIKEKTTVTSETETTIEEEIKGFLYDCFGETKKSILLLFNY
ncbi:MAG: DNA/RNA non-specific endonuclease [Sphaerochaetaceae bacterium]|nr:DNA/RNA non-specific endonuclease [Sphaerochaetaceae bacterium]